MPATVGMKNILIILFTFLCSGCAEGGLYRLGYPNYYYKPTLRYEKIGGDWEIFTPPVGEWFGESQAVTYLPDNFSIKLLRKYNYLGSNFFYARYYINNSVCLALWVRPTTALLVQKTTFGSIVGIDSGYEKLRDNSEDCRMDKQQLVSINFAVADVNFNNSATYFLKNDEKIPGVEIDFSAKAKVRGFTNAKALPQTVYNLASPQTLEDKQPYFRDDTDYPTFYFRFPMTCADLEDAILVIDGFSQNGKPLPPLKVRFNYWDPGAVPGVGAKTTVAR